MTWTDASTSSAPSWTSSGSASKTWTATASAVVPTGNLSRFVDADPLADATGGLDFNNTFSTENPWVFTSTPSSVALTDSNRNDPV